MNELLKQVCQLAVAAGEAILPFYHRHQLNVRTKSDHSPVTDADVAAHEVIYAKLPGLLADCLVVSEEGELPEAAKRQAYQKIWLVDPLDGTQGFIAGSEEFSVNIALIDRQRSVLGVIYSPVSKELYYAAEGVGAYYQYADRSPKPLHIEPGFLLSKARVMIGKYHNAKRLQRIQECYPEIEFLRLNSSLKFGAIADSQADFYPRFGPTSEWDTAAGQCILEQAGGVVVDLQGKSLQYNARNTLENPAFVAIGDPARTQDVLTFIHSLQQERSRS